MKKFLVVLLACALIFGFATTAFAADTQMTDFSDIADQPQAAKTAIMKLAILGVLEGNEGIGGAFRPADSLTRAEFAKIVNYLTGNTKNAESLASVGSRFSDVSTGNWYTGWVNGAAAKGYMQGDPGGTFRPNAEITMNEVVTVCLRAVGYNDNVSQRRGTANRLPWPTNYVTKATDVGVLDDVTFVGSTPATRADMAIIVNAVLDLNMVEYIESDMAFSLALSQGTVDPDGFSEIYYISNETARETDYEKILHKSFGCINVRSVFEFAYNDEFDEGAAWDYDDIKEGELVLHFYAGLGGTEDVASTYYINKDYKLPQLGGMQADVIIDIEGDTANEDEVLFVNVRGTTVYADKAYFESSGSGRIVADGKTYTGSDKYLDEYDSEKDSDGKTTTKTRRIIDLVDEAFPGCGRINIRGTGDTVADKDNTMPAKLYLDKDGYVYAVKSYNIYRDTGFGVFDELDGNIGNFVELSMQKDEWPGKFDTSANHAIVKGNEFIKAEDIDSLDVVYYMGESYSVKRWLVLPSAEGEMTAQNRTDGKLTIDGTSYSAVRVNRFMYSDDGGETFDASFDLTTTDLEKEDFGEAMYAMSYCWPRLAYAAANTNFNKIIGVISTIEPTQNWNDSKTARLERMQQVTIYNAEGKEVTYTFTNDFRDGYTGYVVTYNLYGANTATAFVTPSTSWASKWATAKDKMAEKSIEQFTGTNRLEEGDIVQLVLDKNDKVKRIDNYASYATNVTTKADVKVNSSRERLTIESGDFGNLRGTWTLPKDAIIFAVDPDADGAYDETNIVSAASVLSADFKATKAVAFDVKKTADINVLYYIGDVSVVKYGVITQKGTITGGYYYTINGTKVDAADYDLDHTPTVAAYTMSGGEAKIVGYLAWYNDKVAGKFVPATINPDALAQVGKVSGWGDKYFAIWGKVTNITTSGGRNSIRFEGQENTFVYATADTFLYNLMEDDDATLADLRNDYCLAIYGDYNEAVCVVILGEGYTEAASAPPSSAVGVTSIFDKKVSFVEDTVDGIYKAKYAAPVPPATTNANDRAVHVVNGTTAFLDANIVVATGAKAVFYDSTYTNQVPLAAGNLNAGPADTTFYFIVTAANGTSQRVYELDIYVDAVHIPALASAKVTGDAMVGETLTAAAYEADGTAIAAAGATFRWDRQNANGTFTTNIATGATYVPTAADKGFKLRVQATAVAPVTGGPVYSDLTAAVGELAALQGTVTISGTPSVGETLTAAVNVTSANPGALTYQWLRNGNAISGATGLTYTVTPADSNSLITMRVTAANWAGSVTSASVTVQILPALAGSVTISGTVAVGQTLTASAAIISANPGLVTYSWFISGTATAAQSNTSNTFVVPAAAVGQTITVQISAANYAGTVPSAATIPVPVPTYTVTAPAAGSANGVTATVTFAPASPQVAGTSITATVTLTGTATAAGTFTIDLVSTKAGLASSSVSEVVTAGQDLTATPVTKVFTFTMPAQAVDDLALTFTFV